MPAKSAIKYSSSLCKWLCNIHSEPRFIQKQCIRSRGQDNGFFLQRMLTECGKFGKGIEFHLLPWENGSAFGIPHEYLDNLPKYGRILSSSNGLLLLGDKVSPHYLRGKYKFSLCNPSTRAWAPLATPEGFSFLVSQDFCPLIECYPSDPLEKVEFLNDYTVAFPVLAEPIRFIVDGCRWEENKKIELAIYSKGRWEKELCNVSIEGRPVRYDTPVAFFSNATKGLIVHYLRDRHTPDDIDYLDPYIAVFDIQGKRLLREIKMPEEAVYSHKLWIYKWKETSICLVSWSVGCGWIKAWVLDDYGCKGESWRMVMREVEWDLWADYDKEIVMGVGVANDKGLLIATSLGAEIRRMYVYGLEGEQQGKLELLGEHHLGLGAVKFIPYANTLRLVCIPNSNTPTC